MKTALKIIGYAIGAMVAIFVVFFYCLTILATHDEDTSTLTDRQKAEITRLAGFVDQYSPDDESYWARNEAARQLRLVSGNDSDFYQDQAHIASAYSYVFYGMAYMPMCYHASRPTDLQQLSGNIVKLDSTRRYSAAELAGLQLKAMKAQAYFSHAQGVDDAYKAKMEMIAETEKKNKRSPVRRQLINNQVLFYKLLVGDIASMGSLTDKDAMTDVKAAADSIDNNAISDESELKKMPEGDFQARLGSMMTANCKVLCVYNNSIAQTNINERRK